MVGATLARMCLLLFAWQTGSSFPLIVAANRDEQLDRPAQAFCTLRDQHPRVLGGHDDLAGGTWLATNEHGVVAGLTNRPSPGGRDPGKRTRGELPLVLVGGRTAADGVDALVRRIRPDDYNPAWLLVGDRRSLFYLEVAPGRPVSVQLLAPGVHVLENAPLDQPSPKVERVRSLLSASDGVRNPWTALPSILADHLVPVVEVQEAAADGGGVSRQLETFAACVHTDGYGTRSATVLAVPAATAGETRILVADGPPCTAPFVDVTGRWTR